MDKRAKQEKIRRRRRRRNQKRMILVLMASVFIAIVVLVGIFVKRTFTQVFALSVEGGTNVVVNYNEEFKEPNAKAYYKKSELFSKKKNVHVSVSGDVDTSKIGKYQLIYEASIKGKTKKVTVNVEVKDIEAPVIELVVNPDTYTNPNDEYVEEGFKATDNCDGDVTANVVREEKDGVVTYTVKDSSGNEGKVTRTIVYKDTVAPVITLKNQDNSVITIINVNEEFSEPGYEAIDDCDGDLTEKVTVEGTVDNTTVGVYTLTYKVSDNSGNEGTVNRTVYVSQDKNNPEAQDLGDKVVYLTFDDGPGPYTQQLLDILDKYNVKVTFFVTAHDTNNLYLIGEEYKRGHTVAIHSYTHDYATIYSSDQAFLDDMNKMSDVCFQYTGVRPNLIRFPGGGSNTVSAKYSQGIMTRLTQTIQAMGYQYSDWNVASGDAGNTNSTDQVVQNVITGIQGNSRSSIVLQHDIKDFSVNAVEQIIQWGLANGYTFLPMTETTVMSHHGVNN